MKERLGMAAKIANLKDGLRARQVVLLQVVIEAATRTTEVRNTSSWRTGGRSVSGDNRCSIAA